MKKKKFSKWFKFNNREEIGKEILSKPGIYAIKISKFNIEGTSHSYTDRDIVYIGMTNSIAGLKGRLKQFENTIIGKTGHGGAMRFKNTPLYKRLTKNGSYKSYLNRLYVSVCHFDANTKEPTEKDLITMGDVAKHEYTCWSAYMKAHPKNQLPQFNDKKRSPKK